MLEVNDRESKLKSWYWLKSNARPWNLTRGRKGFTLYINKNCKCSHISSLWPVDLKHVNYVGENLTFIMNLMDVTSLSDGPIIELIRVVELIRWLQIQSLLANRLRMSALQSKNGIRRKKSKQRQQIFMVSCLSVLLCKRTKFRVTTMLQYMYIHLDFCC